jgi:MFS family permease
VTDRRLQLAIAAAGLFLAALDAYAVVTLLPQMLQAVDLPIDHLEAAAPIVTGFLGGYVVAMPLLGAFSDARGRLPAFAVGLGAFAAGSALTALAPALGWLVAGRVLQGLGGGALVPLSLALAADLYPAGGRGLAVGAVAALQEAGSVIGPVYGATLAAGLGGWRAVFWLNLPLAALILLGLWRATPQRPALAGPGRRDVDWVGALLLGLGLGLAVAALYPDDPGNRPLNAYALPFGLAAAALLAAFGWRQARHLRPLVTRGLLRSRAFGGSLSANLLTGGALMVALVDVPILARGVYDLDTFHSGLVLSRFLLGIPIGALVGGALSGWIGQRATSAAGLVVAGGAFVLMSGWGMHELDAAGLRSSGELLLCGVGFGLVIAPLSLAVLDTAATREHGIASGLVVLSRNVGMVVGLAALTAFGLARLQQIAASRHCDTLTAGPGSLADKLNAYETCVRGALLQEYREIFLIAAALCGVAALVALVTLPSRAARPASSRPGRPEAVPE